MRKIISAIRVGKYTLLSLDGPVPPEEHSKYCIDGIEHDIVPVYDLPNNIAVTAEGSFVGKTVQFI